MKSLRECTSSAEVVTLEYDNCDADGFALYCDGSEITIVCRDAPGEVTMPKAAFDRLLLAYEKPQTEALEK